MRRFRLVVTAVAIVSATLALAGCGGGAGRSLADVQKDNKLVVGVKYASPPFGSLNPSTNRPEGFDIDIAEAIGKKILGGNGNVELKKVDTSTRIPLLQQGEIDLSVATITITNDRKKQVDFSEPYLPSGMAIMVPSKSSITSPPDLRGKTNCITAGSVAGDLVANALQSKYGVSTQRTVLDSYPTCLLALKQGRVDFIGTDQGILLGLAKGGGDLKVIPGLLTDEPWGIAVRKGNDKMVAAVNNALNELFRDGTWTALYNKWLGQAPPQGWPPAQ